VKQAAARGAAGSFEPLGACAVTGWQEGHGPTRSPARISLDLVGDFLKFTGMKLRLEEIDLAETTEQLASRVSLRSLVGFLEGKTRVRDALIELLQCSELEAENIVDTLIAQGYMRFGGDPLAVVDDGVWELRQPAQ
jgi:hypothetical protein